MSYLQLNPTYINKTIKKAIKKVEKLNFDSIAYTGHSGALVAIPMALQLNKRIVIVRKPHEKSHGSALEVRNSVKKCLIVDDFVETGKTIKRIIKHLNYNAINIEAILLYDSTSNYKKFEGIKVVGC